MISLLTPDGGKAIGVVSIQTPDGSKTIARVLVLTADGDRVVYDNAGAGGSTLAVAIEPFTVTGSALDDSARPVTTDLARATVTGGTAPYTYTWTQDAGDTNWTVLYPSTASTRFAYADLAAGGAAAATFRCTATDARGRTAYATVEATVYNYGSWEFI